MTTRERLLKIVDKALVDFSEQISLYVQKRMNRSYRDRFLYAFSLHLSAFLKRVKSNETIPYTEIEGAIPQDKECLTVAEDIGHMIETHYHLQVPRAEIEYIALLLESSDDDELEELEDAIALKNISNMPARVKCAVLAWHTLKAALEKQN